MAEVTRQARGHSGRPPRNRARARRVADRRRSPACTRTFSEDALDLVCGPGIVVTHGNLLLAVGPRRLRAVAAHGTHRESEVKDLAEPSRRATARGRARVKTKRARDIQTRAREALLFRFFETEGDSFLFARGSD